MAGPDDIAARLARIEDLLRQVLDRLGEVEASTEAVGLTVEALLSGDEAVDAPDDARDMISRALSPRSPRTDT